jgi:hypothetical protein
MECDRGRKIFSTLDRLTHPARAVVEKLNGGERSFPGDENRSIKRLLLMKDRVETGNRIRASLRSTDGRSTTRRNFLFHIEVEFDCQSH